MARLAILAPPFTSHVRALVAVAHELIGRGHEVHWVHSIDVAASLRHPAIAFHPVGMRTHPAGSLAGVVARAANPGGPRGLGRVIADVAAATDMLCLETPALLERLGVEALVADEMEAAGGLVAMHLRLPFVSVACALPVAREPAIPLPVMHWGYARDLAGLRMNEGSTRVYDWLMRPHARVIRRHAERFGLAVRERLDQCLSPQLGIAQTVAGFDFPRQMNRPEALGPLRMPLAARGETLRLPGLDAARPFAFVSLGTLQGGRYKLFERIVRACRALGVQSLVAHCGLLGAAQVQALRQAGADWVTDFAPQGAAIERADLVVTHGGLNTVMDCLAAGKPMLVLPIAFDQPGCAARVVHAGAGLRLLPLFATRARIASALSRLLEEPAFGQAAKALAPSVETAGGARRAADLIEERLALRAARPSWQAT